MYEDRYAGRNPFYAPPRALVDVALEPGETVDRQIVHRISPEDPWRRVRNRWRAEGVFAGPPPQPPTYLIGSSGVTLYRGNAFPAEYRQDVFIGVAGNNLVHHRRAGARRRRLPRAPAARRIDRGVPGLDRPLVPAGGVRQRPGRRALHRRLVPGDPRFLRRHSRVDQALQGSQPRQRPRPHLSRRARRLQAANAAEARARQHGRPGRDAPASQCVASGDGRAAALRAPGQGAPSRRSRSWPHNRRRPLGRLHALYALDGLDALAEVVRAACPRRSGPGVQGARRPAVGADHRGRAVSPTRCGSS